MVVVAAVIGFVATGIVSLQMIDLAKENRELRAANEKLSEANDEERIRGIEPSRERAEAAAHRSYLDSTLAHYKKENGELADKLDGFRDWLANESRMDSALKVVVAKLKSALDYDQLPVEKP